MNSSIDFIGDIHGHCEELRMLLKKLGYEESMGAFRYPGGERSVVFLGDYIDRGSQSREVIDLVRAMRDAGSAVALMGNHEFNALCFWQQNGAGGSHVIHCIPGGYLREHSFNKVAIHTRTVESYKGRKKEFEDMLKFLRTLPFFIDAPTFRAQHACFDRGAAEALKAQGICCFADGNFDELIARANDQFNEYEDSLFDPINYFLKGPEMNLPDGITFRDGEGVLRKEWSCLPALHLRRCSGTTFMARAKSRYFSDTTGLRDSRNLSGVTCAASILAWRATAATGAWRLTALMANRPWTKASSCGWRLSRRNPC